MQDTDWDDFRLVLALARTGAIVPCAKSLGVNETTISRRLRRLEARLNCVLFERKKGHATPTRLGQSLVDQAEEIEHLVGQSMARATGADNAVSGLVRVSSIPLLVNRVLVAKAGPFLREHPQLTLALIADHHNVRLLNRDADIAIRLARPRTDNQAMTRKLGNIEYAAYVQRGLDPNDVPWIPYDQEMSDLLHAKWISDKIGPSSSHAPQLQVRDAETLYEAIRKGLGKSLLPSTIGDADTALIRVDGKQHTLTREVWLMAHPDIRHLQRIRVVTEWAATALTPYLDPT